MGGQPRSGVDGGGAVRAANDADRGRLRPSEDGKPGRHVSNEDAQLGGSSQQQSLGVGNQGGKVCASAYAHENQAGVDAQLYAQVQIVQKAAMASAQLCPVDDAVRKELGVVHTRAGQIGQQHTKGNGQKQQGLKLLDNGKIQQHAGDDKHHQIQGLVGHNGKTRALQKGLNCFHWLHSFSNSSAR